MLFTFPLNRKSPDSKVRAWLFEARFRAFTTKGTKDHEGILIIRFLRVRLLRNEVGKDEAVTLDYFSRTHLDGA